MTIVLGAVLGIVVTLLFLGSTPLILGPLVKANPQASPATALLFFGAKVVAATLALLLLFDVGGVSDHVDLMAFGIAVAVSSLAWSVLLVMRFKNSRTPTYDLGDDSA